MEYHPTHTHTSLSLELGAVDYGVLDRRGDVLDVVGVDTCLV